MNSDPEFNEQKGDKAYINTLLIRLFEIEELASHDELSRGKLNFIKGSPKFIFCAEYISYIYTYFRYVQTAYSHGHN